MRGSFYTPRESLIPKGALKVSDKLSDAVAYLYPSDSGRSHGKPAMMVFYGQQSKPVARFYYQNDDERERAVKRYFDGRRQHDAAKTERQAKAKAEVATIKFEVGKTYHDRDTIYSFKIVARTDKTLTIEEHGETYRRGVYVYDGVESCKPHGTYSMCSVIRANRVGEA